MNTATLHTQIPNTNYSASLGFNDAIQKNLYSSEFLDCKKKYNI